VLEGKVVIRVGDRIRPIRAIEKKRLKSAMRKRIRESAGERGKTVD
jgi:hypothetical protein